MAIPQVVYTDTPLAPLLDIDIEGNALDEKSSVQFKPVSKLRTGFWRVVTFLTPSFLNVYFAGEKPIYGKAHPTSYLDGLRGVAAWFVFNTHLSPLVSRAMGAGWGHTEATPQSFLQLPFLHTLHAGGYPIHIFFVVGGLVSSLSTVKAMEKHPQDSAGTFKKLSSSIFKRPLRLFFPSWASTIVPFFLIRFDVFRLLDGSKNPEIITGWPVLQEWPNRTSSIFPQIFHWLSENLRMLRVISEGADDDFVNRYNPVLWTIPLEFQCSMFLLLTQAALFYVKQPTRIALIIATIVLTCYIGQVFIAVFWGGWLLAEIYTVQSTLRVPVGSVYKRILLTVTVSVILVLALYVSSYPRWQPERTNGFRLMHALTPPAIGFTADFWHGLAAVLTIYCVGQLELLADFFAKPVFRYLGRISFALYLTHYWIIHIVGTLVFEQVWKMTGWSNVFTNTMGFSISYGIVWIVSIWGADLFTRHVETPCTSIGEALTNRIVTKG